MSAAPRSDQAGASPADTRVTFVGHSTVAIEAAGTRVLTDPLLRDGLFGFLRRRPPLPHLGAAGRPDAVLISHLHYDHLDLPSLRSLPSGTPIVAPRGSRGFLGRRGFHDVVELDEGEGLQVGAIRVTAVHARHGRGGRPGAGRVGSVGYLVEAKARIYFAGDTELFAEMVEIGPGIDCALLPIWGWGPRLGPRSSRPVHGALNRFACSSRGSRCPSTGAPTPLWAHPRCGPGWRASRQAGSSVTPSEWPRRSRSGSWPRASRFGSPTYRVGPSSHEQGDARDAGNHRGRRSGDQDNRGLVGDARRRRSADHPRGEHRGRGRPAHRSAPVDGGGPTGGRRGPRARADLPRSGAARFLDDKLLDADVVDEDVRFRLDTQAEAL